MWAASAFLVYGMSHFTESAYRAAAKRFTEDLTKVNLKGRSFMVTGANSGLGFGTAQFLASQGGTVHMVCRNKARGSEAVEKIRKQTGSENVHLHICDVSEMKDIRHLVNRFEKDYGALDVLINNAGVMLETREVTSEGICKHLATNTLSGFLLTWLLLPLLSKSTDARVIFVSSGGMLTQPLLIRDDYEYQSDKFSGMIAYARTKRHQVALANEFSKQIPNIKFYSTHPAWTDTPGVQTSMPEFHDRFEDNLRPVEHGCDTMNWIAVSPSLVLKDNGLFFRDREEEIQHLPLASTFYEPWEQTALFVWCRELCGVLPYVDELRAQQEKLKAIVSLSSKGGVKAIQLTDEISKLLGVNTDVAICQAQILQLAGFITPQKPFRHSKKGEYAWGTVPTTDELKEIVSDKWLDNLLQDMDISTNKSWVLAKESPKFKIFSCSLNWTDLKPVLAIFPTAASKSQLKDVLVTTFLEKHRNWNKSFSNGRIIEQIDKEHTIHHWVFDLGSFVSKRDFVVLRRVREMKDGRIVIAEKSIVHGKQPETSKCIRCQIVYQIRVITPQTKEVDGPCTLTVMNLTDIGGWFPFSSVNSANIEISVEELDHICSTALKTKPIAD